MVAPRPLLWFALLLLLVFLRRSDAAGGWPVFPEDSSSSDLAVEGDGGPDDHLAGFDDDIPSLDDDVLDSDFDDEIPPVTGGSLPKLGPIGERVVEFLLRPASAPSQRLFRPPRTASA